MNTSRSRASSDISLPPPLNRALSEYLGRPRVRKQVVRKLFEFGTRWLLHVLLLGAGLDVLNFRAANSGCLGLEFSIGATGVFGKDLEIDAGGGEEDWYTRGFVGKDWRE